MGARKNEAREGGNQGERECVSLERASPRVSSSRVLFFLAPIISKRLLRLQILGFHSSIRPIIHTWLQGLGK